MPEAILKITETLKLLWWENSSQKQWFMCSRFEIKYFHSDGNLSKNCKYC